MALPEVEKGGEERGGEGNRGERTANHPRLSLLLFISLRFSTRGGQGLGPDPSVASAPGLCLMKTSTVASVAINF